MSICWPPPRPLKQTMASSGSPVIASQYHTMQTPQHHTTQTPWKHWSVLTILFTPPRPFFTAAFTVYRIRMMLSTRSLLIMCALFVFPSIKICWDNNTGQYYGILTFWSQNFVKNSELSSKMLVRRLRSPIFWIVDPSVGTPVRTYISLEISIKKGNSRSISETKFFQITPNHGFQNTSDGFSSKTYNLSKKH